MNPSLLVNEVWSGSKRPQWPSVLKSAQTYGSQRLSLSVQLPKVGGSGQSAFPIIYELAASILVEESWLGCKHRYSAGPAGSS